MLRVARRSLSTGALETVAERVRDDPVLADLGIELLEPVRVSGRIMASGPGAYYWEGRIRTRVAGQCRRCLEPADAPLAPGGAVALHGRPGRRRSRGGDHPAARRRARSHRPGARGADSRGSGVPP